MSDGADVVAHVHVGSSHPAFAGHFPGHPILPGVALLAMVLEAAMTAPSVARAIGPAPQLAVVKFVTPVEPNTSLVIAIRVGATAIEWRIDDPANARPIANGRFARSSDRTHDA